MAGRDIGTVVFPDADHKFFLDGQPRGEGAPEGGAVRKKRGERVDEDAMRREVEARDRVDTERAVAPLRPAPDAILIDTDKLDVDQVVGIILQHVGTKRGAR